MVKDAYMNMAIYSISLGIVLFPFYLFPSGLPQLAHALFFAGALISIYNNKTAFTQKSNALTGPLLCFVIYVCLIALIQSFLYAVAGDPLARKSLVVSLFTSAEPLTYALFYVFNYVVFIGVISTGTSFYDKGLQEVFWRYLLIAVMLCLAIQVLIGISGSGRTFKTSFRAILFFNNPNQLGYFSVLAATLIFMVQASTKKYLGLAMGGYACALYVSALALSKAALVSMVSVPLIFLFGSKSNVGSKLIAIIFCGLLVISGVFLVNDQVIDRLEARFSNFGAQQQDDSLEGRAYDRLVKFPEYLVLGAAEGLRLGRFGGGNEIHSLFATVLFSYGLVGLGLLLVFLIRLFRLVGVKNFSYLVPVAFYNLTHNGIRSPLLWMILALLVVKALKEGRSGTV